MILYNIGHSIVIAVEKKMVWLSKIVQNLYTVLVTDATWMICCHVSLKTGCTNDTVDQGYLFSSKPCHQSFAYSHPFLYGFEFRQFLLFCFMSAVNTNSLSKNCSSLRLSSSSSDNVTSVIAKAVGFLLFIKFKMHE